VKNAGINGFMNSQEKIPHHLPPTLKPFPLEKTLVKETLMKVYTLSPVKTLMFSHFQEEEEIPPMTTMDHTRKPTHSPKKFIIIITTPEISEKVILTKKFTVLLLLIPTFFQLNGEE